MADPLFVKRLGQCVCGHARINHADILAPAEFGGGRCQRIIGLGREICPCARFEAVVDPSPDLRYGKDVKESS